MRLAGIISLSLDGVDPGMRGRFYLQSLGTPLREALGRSPDSVTGFKETPQVPFIEGDLRYTRTLTLKLFTIKAGSMRS